MKNSRQAATFREISHRTLDLVGVVCRKNKKQSAVSCTHQQQKWDEFSLSIQFCVVIVVFHVLLLEIKTLASSLSCSRLHRANHSIGLPSKARSCNGSFDDLYFNQFEIVFDCSACFGRLDRRRYLFVCAEA